MDSDILAENGYSCDDEGSNFTGKVHLHRGRVKKEFSHGRPRLPHSKARSRRVVTFVTENEMKELHRLSAAQQSSLSALCHRLIRAALTNSAIVDAGANESIKVE
jgi:hypothetical protein